ncbi:hypothetical protein ACOSP7_006121 [Xanthoceras sorbifolium]
MNPSGFETQRVRRSNPLGSISNPEGFVLRTHRVRDLTLLGSISNPLGSTNPEGFEDRTLLGFEPSGFVEPRRVRRYEPFWSWNSEGSKIEPSGFDLEPRRVRRHEPRRVRSSNPLGSISNPEGSWFFEDELRR